MANLLIDLSLTSAHAVGATFADITGMSATVSVNGPGSVVILMMGLNPIMDTTGDDCADYRFTHDGAAVGPIVSGFKDQVDKGSGRTLKFALTGLSAGSHTFAVQAQNRTGVTDIDTTRVRTFQALEIQTGASLLVDLATVVADTAPASFANLVNLSASATPAAGSILLFNAGTQLLGTAANAAADYRFAIDGVRDGPELTETQDEVDEAQGLAMAWAVEGISAVSHTFSIQWQIRANAPVQDTDRQRIFQVVELTTDADLLVDVQSVSADSAPVAYADMADMSGTPVIDSTDSIALVLANYVQTAQSDITADHILSIASVQEGAEVSAWTDGVGAGKADALLMARGVTGQSGATAMSLQWKRRLLISTTDTARPRTFQVIDLKVPGEISASPDLALTAAADLQGVGGISASAALAITAAADLQGIGGISAGPALAFTLAAPLTNLQEISASPAMAFTLTAALRNATPVSTLTSRHIEKFIN